MSQNITMIVPAFRYYVHLLETRKGAILVSLTLFIMVLMTTYPIFLESMNSPDQYAYFFNKIDAPLETISTPQHTHAAKGAFRLTIPLIAKLLDLGIKKDARKIVFMFIIQSCLLLPFFFLLIRILKKHLNSSQILLFILGCAFVYVSKAFFWDADFWFDGFAYFFLLLGMYFRNRAGIFVALTFASWTDERAFIALSSVYFFHLLLENNFDLNHYHQIFNGDFYKKRSFMPVLAGCCYLLVRLFLAAKFSLQTPYGGGAGVSITMIPEQISSGPAGIFLAFEGLWLFLLILIIHTWKQQKFLVLCMFAGLVILHIAVAYSVFDFTRSLTYAFPIFIIAVIYVATNVSPPTNQVFMLATLLCICIPTEYFIRVPYQIPWLIFSFEKLGSALHSIFITPNVSL
ncbi:hypothetical protein [Dyadobacter alkalitolerans]|uniref:hypothetical protein n=1 Tax=Dyadobacter alkalitolerans TaxID=492736 RepID=UPI0003FD49BA|nr:hypothetical protein [Dyadobacter alkalitolerans]